MIDKEVSKERLLKTQKHLFSNQLLLNKSLVNKTIDVLVENKIAGQNKYFGRNNYMNSVFFEGDEKNIGRMLKIKIDKVNQNSLFGKIQKNNKRAA